MSSRSSPKAAKRARGVALFREHRPDITLMDLNMPEMGGVEAIGAIRDEFPDARIIILTTYDGDEDIFRGLRAGAKAYLLKEGPVEQLVETVRAVYRGQVRIPQEVAAKLAQRMTSPNSPRASWRSATHRRGQKQRGDRQRALHHRGDRQSARQQHPEQIRCERPHPGRDHRAQARNRSPEQLTTYHFVSSTLVAVTGHLAEYAV
jgi:DNA-binding response OmpR family regulator